MVGTNTCEDLQTKYMFNCPKWRTISWQYILNHQREDNLYIKDKMPGPKVSIIWRFHCTCTVLYTIIHTCRTSQYACSLACCFSDGVECSCFFSVCFKWSSNTATVLLGFSTNSGEKTCKSNNNWRNVCRDYEPFVESLHWIQLLMAPTWTSSHWPWTIDWCSQEQLC